MAKWAVVRVEGVSMVPTLAPGDVLVVRRVACPVRGDVPLGSLVVCRLPGGRPLSVKRATMWVDGGWWLERDNPSAGADSALFGEVAPRDVVGVVVARLWPRPRRLVAAEAMS